VVNRFLSIALCITMPFFSYAISQSNPTVCDELSSLKPNDPDTAYRAFLQKLHRNGESLCNCIQQHAQQQIENTKTLLAQEWGFSEHQWIRMNKFLARIAEHDHQTREIEVEDPQKIRQKLEHTNFNVNTLKKAFQKMGYRQGKMIMEINTAASEPYNRNVLITRPILYSNENAIVRNYTIKFGPKFFQRSDGEKLGNFIHELERVRQQDPIHFSYLLSSITLQHSINPVQVKNSSSFQAHANARTQQADQIPTACCINSDNAKFLEAWLAAEVAARPEDTTLAQRLAAVTRIRRLKEMEEQHENLPQGNPLKGMFAFFKR
jgi:hypothetical protein